jgi:hypothetical protein
MSHSKKKKDNGKTLGQAKEIFGKHYKENSELFKGRRIGQPYQQHDKTFFPAFKEKKLVSRTVIFPDGVAKTFNL